MKILVVCEWGINRSHTIATQLKWWNHDVLSAGVAAQSAGTLELLGQWADRIIVVDELTAQHPNLGQFKAKIQLWDIGPDVYLRPFNRELLHKVQTLMETHRGEYAP